MPCVCIQLNGLHSGQVLKSCLKAAGLALALLPAGCGQQTFETVMFMPAKRLAPDAMPCSYSKKTRKSCENAVVEEIFFPSLDPEITLQALYFPNPDSDKMIVYFHGNGWHLYIRVPAGVKLSGIANVLILSYRGYGKSEGEPSEAGIYEDAWAALRYVRDELKFEPQNTYIYGRSLGAAVAVEVAQRQSYAGLILVSPFLSGKAMAEKAGLGWYPRLGKPFHSVGKVRNITSPALFMHGTADAIVPFEQGVALYEAYSSPDKTFKTMEGAGHSWFWRSTGDEYWGWVREFVVGSS